MNTATIEPATVTAAAPLWAAGNGARRHIVRPGSLYESGGRRYARALCDHPRRPVLLMHFPDDDTPRGHMPHARTSAQIVTAARPCRQCAHLAIRANAGE